MVVLLFYNTNSLFMCNLSYGLFRDVRLVISDAPLGNKLLALWQHGHVDSNVAK